jgi:hypothetical protein
MRSRTPEHEKRVVVGQEQGPLPVAPLALVLQTLPGALHVLAET